MWIWKYEDMVRSKTEGQNTMTTKEKEQKIWNAGCSKGISLGRSEVLKDIEEIALELSGKIEGDGTYSNPFKYRYIDVRQFLNRIKQMAKLKDETQ